MKPRAYARKYLAPPRHRGGQRLTLRTEDGVRLDGTWIPGPAGAPAVVLVHGLFGHQRDPRLVVFAGLLARRFSVLLPTLRGHRRSAGLSSLGDREILDVDAAVRKARDLGAPAVATVGISLGGISVVRHAGLLRGVDAVVSISAPAGWGRRDRPGAQRTGRTLGRRRGRAAARVFLRTRFLTGWEAPEPPMEVAAAIPPTPFLVVHGRDDHFFDPEQAEILAAAGTGELWLYDVFGHGTDGLDAAFALRLTAALEDWLGVDPAGRGPEARTQSR